MENKPSEPATRRGGKTLLQTVLAEAAISELLETPKGSARFGASPLSPAMRRGMLLAASAMMERMGLTRRVTVPKGLGKTYKRKQWAKIKKARKVAEASRRRNRR